MSEILVLSGQLELVPVVEFSPFEWSENYFDHITDDSADRTTGKIELFWKRCMAEAGMPELEMVSGSFYQVSIEQIIEPNTIRQLIQKYYDSEYRTFEEFFNAIPGGGILFHNQKIIFEPQCRCNLGSIENWREIATYRDMNWEMLWIGHPYLWVQFDEGKLVFSQPVENDCEEPEGKYAIDSSRLQEVVEKAEVMLSSFREKTHAMWIQLYL